MVRQSYNLQRVPPDISSTHLTPYIVITVSLTIFPIVYFTSPWWFCNYQSVLLMISDSNNTSAHQAWCPSFIDVEVRPGKLSDLPMATQLTSDFRPGFKLRCLSPILLPTPPCLPSRKKEEVRMCGKTNINNYSWHLLSVYCVLGTLLGPPFIMTLKATLWLFPFFRGERWGLERLSNMSKVTQLGRSELWFEPRQADSKGINYLEEQYA